MSNVERSLQESVVLHNTLISILPKMYKTTDKPLYAFVRNHVRENTTAATESIRSDVCVNLVKEVFSLLNQLWANDLTRFDEGLANEKNILRVIKSQIATDGKPLPFNNRELYKRIRESIVHNSTTNPNFVYDLNGFKLNLGKVNGQDYIVTLSFKQLIDLIYVLKSNVKKNKIYGEIYIKPVSTIKTRTEIKDNIKILDDAGNPTIELDNNQIERIYTYFRYMKNNMDIIGNELLLKNSFHFAEDAESLFGEKLQALTVMHCMSSGSSWKDLTTQFPTLAEHDGFVNFYFALISNLMFTVASTQTNAEIETMLNGCVPNITTNDVRHTRNSLCHGRYFHDFNKTFYFYDGKKNLDYKFKLTIDDINKLLDKIAKGSYEVAVLK